jgi:hypothetical protein
LRHERTSEKRQKADVSPFGFAAADHLNIPSTGLAEL